MSVTIEVIAPPGEPLTATLFPWGAETAAVTDVALTERINSAGVYRGMFTAGPEGAHRVLVFNANDALLASTSVVLTGDDGQVAYCSDEALILSRIEEQVASGPVAAVPAPPTDYQTTVHGTCYDDDGSLKAGVTVTLSIDSAKQAGHGLYTKHERTDISDANGLVTFSIPRNPSLRFSLRVGDGQAVTFQGVDAASLQLPLCVGT